PRRQAPRHLRSPRAGDARPPEAPPVVAGLAALRVDAVVDHGARLEPDLPARCQHRFDQCRLLTGKERRSGSAETLAEGAPDVRNGVGAEGDVRPERPLGARAGLARLGPEARDPRELEQAVGEPTRSRSVAEYGLGRAADAADPVVRGERRDDLRGPV